MTSDNLFNKEFISIILGFITVITPYIMFILSKRKEQEQRNFERFHINLIGGLSNQKGEIGLYEQVAIIFELRNYPRYYPVIKRLLRFQISKWTRMLGNKPALRELIIEAKKTINFAEKNWFERNIVEKVKHSIDISS